MLRANVENCLILVVAQFEILLSAMEVLFEHGHVVVLKCVVKWQVPVVVDDIRSWSNFINDRQLLLNANYVLNRLSLVVLHATSLEELVITAEPVKYVLIAVPRAFKEWVLSQVVALFEGLKLVLSEKLKHLQILHLSGKENWIMTFEIRSQTSIPVQFE